MSALEGVHVVAGVLRDPMDRVLLARRVRGRDLAGLWEFPGGKREPGETVSAALARELYEELGVRVQASRPLICVPFDYPGKRILLDVHIIERYDGQPYGRERQALAWAPQDSLHNYPMPPADRPVLAALEQSEWLAITPEPGADLDRFIDRARSVAISGVRVLQLRAPALGLPAQRELAAKLLVLLKPLGCELLLNADIEGAARLGCGLHLRAAQLAQCEARPLPAGTRVSAACHHADDLRRAEQLGLDLVLLGPVQETASHPQQAPLGWPEFARLRAQCSLPIYALGGLGRHDLTAARRHGAQGIAAIRGFWDG